MRSWIQYGFLHGVRYGNQGLREFPWNRGSETYQAAIVVVFWPLDIIESRARFSSFWLSPSIPLLSLDNFLSLSSLDRIHLPALSDEKVENCTDFSHFTELLLTIRVNGNAPNRTILHNSCSAYSPKTTTDDVMENFDVWLYCFVSHPQLLRQYPGHLRDGRQSGPLGHCSGHTVGLSQFPLLHTDGAAVLSDLVGRPAGGGRRRRRRGSAVELRPGAGLAIAQVRETQVINDKFYLFKIGCDVLSSPTSKA